MAQQKAAEKRPVTSLAGGNCRYGFFNRHEGVSEPPFASLNIGLAVGDDDSRVEENRRLVRQRMGAVCLLSGRQVHGDRVYLLERSLTQDEEVAGYDALISRQRGVGLVIQHADCQAVLLYDPVGQAIGAVHSGWRGSVANIIGKTVAAMTEAFTTNPAHLQALISPSLGPCCAEFVNYALELPVEFQRYMDERAHFNFWEISRRQLQDAGLPAEAITLPEVCTCCSSDYFSYRRACRQTDGITGRNCSVIVLDNR